MKRVLFITVRADMGGGPKHVFDLCKNLKDIEIHIACPNEAPFYAKYRTITSNVIEIPHRKFSIFKFLRLIQYCKDNGINVVHSHGRGAGIYSRIMSLWGIKFIHTYHGIHFKRSIKSSIVLYIERMMKCFDGDTICVSEDEYSYGKNFGIIGNNSIIIENGVDAKIQEKFENELVIGSLSRLDKIKRIDELIDIIKIDRNIKKYIIAGDGEHKATIITKISELNLDGKIEMMGLIEDIDKFFKRIRVYISNSEREGLPLSVLEAMGRGIPVALSKVPGHIAIQNKSNLNFTFSTTTEFISLVKEINEKFELYSKEVYRIYNENYSLERMVKDTLKFYHSS